MNNLLKDSSDADTDADSDSVSKREIRSVLNVNQICDAYVKCLYLRKPGPRVLWSRSCTILQYNAVQHS